MLAEHDLISPKNVGTVLAVRCSVVCAGSMCHRGESKYCVYGVSFGVWFQVFLCCLVSCLVGCSVFALLFASARSLSVIVGFPKHPELGCANSEFWGMPAKSVIFGVLVHIFSKILCHFSLDWQPRQFHWSIWAILRAQQWCGSKHCPHTCDDSLVSGLLPRERASAWRCNDKWLFVVH